MKIGYVCTNYNNSAFTAEAIMSLSANVGHQFHIVVVDNNSAIESKRQLEQSMAGFVDVDLVLNPTNLGYFPGLNVGIQRLRSKLPALDVIVVGNNDLVFPPDFGHAIEANRDKFEVHAVISPNIITLDGTHQNPHVIERISKPRELIYDLYYANYYAALLIRQVAKLTRGFTDREDEMQHAVAQPIYQGHGACYILGPKFFEHFTELWAPTFLMGEEFFLSRQLEGKGIRKFYEPSIVVRHHCHAAVDQVPSRRMWEISRDAHKEYRKYVRVFD